MNEPTLTLRKAHSEDIRFYWEVNNTPTTRALSISPEPIPWEGHKAWYAARLSDPQTTLYVAELNEKRVGVLRVERGERGRTTISIALSEVYQGRGLGRQLIAEGTRLTLASPDITQVIALIRPNNIGSVRAFQAAGYQADGEAIERGVSLLRFIAT